MGFGYWLFPGAWRLGIGALTHAFRTPTAPLVRARAPACAHRVFLVVLAQAAGTDRPICSIASARASHSWCLNAAAEDSNGPACCCMWVAHRDPRAPAVGLFFRGSPPARPGCDRRD